MSNIHLSNGGYITKSSKPVLTRNRNFTGNVGFGLYWDATANKWSDTSTNNISITTGTSIIAYSTLTPYTSGGLGSLRVANSADSASTAISATSSTFTFGTGDFTVSAWLYTTGTYKTYNCIFEGQSGGGTRTNSFVWYLDSQGRHNVFAAGVGIFGPSTTTVSSNSWTHVLISRTSGVTRIYQNGSQIGSNFSTLPNITTNYWSTVKIGDSGNYYPGHIANYVVVKGASFFGTATTYTIPTTEIQKTYITSGTIDTSTYGVYIIS